MKPPESSPPSLEVCVAELERIIKTIRSHCMELKLRQYPAGHPEEPAELKKFREQNPDFKVSWPSLDRV